MSVLNEVVQGNRKRRTVDRRFNRGGFTRTKQVQMETTPDNQHNNITIRELRHCLNVHEYFFTIN